MKRIILVILSLRIVIIFWILFTSFYKHFLLTLIRIEFFIINIIYLIFNLLSYLNLRIYLFIYMLVIIVCERVLGLRLIVIIVRYEGNDYLKILVLLDW